MSMLRPMMRGKPAPCWSVVNPAAAVLLPTPMAGLPVSSAMVSVGPPLLVTAPSMGFNGKLIEPVRSEPTQPLLLSASPIRLKPREAMTPKTSGPLLLLAVFPAMIVLTGETVPELYAAALPGRVRRDRVAGERQRGAGVVENAPPEVVAQFPESVSLVSVTVPPASL